MAFSPSLPSGLGLPTPRQVDMYVKKWSPDSALHIGNGLMPIQNHFLPNVEWDEVAGIQGLAQAHSLDSEPQSVVLQPHAHKTERSMYFKEFMKAKESDFLNIRAAGTQAQLAGRQLIQEMADTLNTRLDARLEQLRWAAAQGTVTIDENGIKRTITYGVQSNITPSTPWSTVASAVPITDLQTAMLALRGTGSGRCTLYINQYVANLLANNAAFQTAVRQAAGSALTMSPDNLNQGFALLCGGELQVVVYDEGYTAVGGTFTPFIPNTRALLIKGTPKSQPLGAFKTTPSVHNGGPENPMPGRFSVVDAANINSKNPRYEITVGMYGVPVIYFPQCIQPIVVA